MHHMLDMLFYLLVIMVLSGGLIVGGLFARGYLAGEMPTMATFMSLVGAGPRPEPRLDVVEQASIDGKRRLLLVRRDDVEHLIMTGGPVDMVIETGIGQRRQPVAEVVEAPVYSRQPRRFGQAVGE